MIGTRAADTWMANNVRSQIICCLFINCDHGLNLYNLTSMIFENRINGTSMKTSSNHVYVWSIQIECVRSMTSSNTNEVLTYPEWWTWSISWTVSGPFCQTRFLASVLLRPDWRMCWTFARSLSPSSSRPWRLLWLFFND